MTETDTIRSNPWHPFASFGADERGATAIEYAMIASAIGGVLAATVFTLGGNVNVLFTRVSGLFP